MRKVLQLAKCLGLSWLLCLAGFRVAAGQTKPAVPNGQIDLSSFGFSGLSPLNRLTDRINLSLNFIDSDHLLFTFNAHNSRALLVRDPDCAPSTSCHMVHAVVIDLRNNEVTASADWELYDYRKYLWPLGNSRFLLRRANKFYQVGADLAQTLLYSSPDELPWAGMTADRKQLILESNPVSAHLVWNPEQGKDVEQRERDPNKVNIEFRDVNSLQVVKILHASQISEIDSLSSGYADALHNLVHQTWLIRFGSNDEKRRDLMQVRSPCRPQLLYPTDKTLFVGRCSPDSASYSVSVFTLTGHPLWRQRWSQKQFDLGILCSDDGSRIVASTITASRDDDGTAPDDNDLMSWPDVEQDIRVLEAATGNEILETVTKTAILNNASYSLSPDGRRFALIDGNALNLYELPPMTTEERARYVAMDADAPELAALPPSSAGDTGQDSSESESEAAEAGPERTLAAPLRIENRAPIEIPNASGNASSENVNAVQKPKTEGAETANAHPQGANQDQNPPIFEVNTQEVAVDVVITDSKGHPVKGLSKGDFQVQENGQPQELASFREYGDPSLEPAKPEASAPPVPNVFNNNDNASPDQPMVVILLDYLNTQPADQMDAIQQLAKFLRAKPQGTRFALFTLTERLQMLQGFTSDENQLLATLRSRGAGPTESSDLQRIDLGGVIEDLRQEAQINPGMERDVQIMMDSQANIDAAQLNRRVLVTTDSFAALARYLNATPGRKSLIWLSGSFPLSFLANEKASVDTADVTPVQSTFSDLVRNTTNLLAEAHIAVYPVNVRGVVLSSLPGADEHPDTVQLGLPGSQSPAAAHEPNEGATNQASAMVGSSELERRMEDFRKDRLTEDSAMDQVASETGGKAFQDANDLTKAMQTAAELSSHYYLLTYSPKKDAHDNAFRSIKVTLAKKGLHVACRRGYYAVPKLMASPKSDLKIALNSAAMEQGLPQARQLVFAARVVPVGKPRKAASPSSAGPSGPKTPLTDLQRYSVDYAITASELHFATGDKGHSANLLLMAAAFGEKGVILNQAAYQSVTALNPAAYKDTQIGGLRLHQDFDVPAKANSLRLGIVDVLSGHLGTLELPLPLAAPPEQARQSRRHLPPLEPN